MIFLMPFYHGYFAWLADHLGGSFDPHPSGILKQITVKLWPEEAKRCRCFSVLQVPSFFGGKRTGQLILGTDVHWFVTMEFRSKDASKVATIYSRLRTSKVTVDHSYLSNTLAHCSHLQLYTLQFV